MEHKKNTAKKVQFAKFELCYVYSQISFQNSKNPGEKRVLDLKEIVGR